MDDSVFEPGTLKFGRMTTDLPESVLIPAGEEYRLPREGEIMVQPSLGRDRFTVFASTGNAPAGLLLRASADDVSDRFLHRTRQPGYDAPADVDPPEVFKTTIVIETY